MGDSGANLLGCYFNSHSFLGSQHQPQRGNVADIQVCFLLVGAL